MIFFLSLFPFSCIKKHLKAPQCAEGCFCSNSKKKKKGFIFCLCCHGAALSCTHHLCPFTLKVFEASFDITDHFILMWEQCCRALCRKKDHILVRRWHIIPGCCGLCRDQWTNTGGERQRRINNKGITGLVTPPKFFRNYSEQPPHPVPPQSDTLSPPDKEEVQSESPVFFSALPFPSPSSTVKIDLFFLLDCLHHCVACLLCWMRKHTATELLIQGALAIVLPLVKRVTVYLTVLQEMFCMIFFNFICW